MILFSSSPSILLADVKCLGRGKMGNEIMHKQEEEEQQMLLSETTDLALSPAAPLIAGRPFSGYGHIAPSTILGKLFTMIYTIIGTPLFLLYISSIGDIMATSFKWTYSR